MKKIPEAETSSAPIRMHPNKGIANLRRLVALTDISALAEKERLVAEFWASMGNNPIIEELSDGSTCNLTFVYQGGAEVESLGLCGAIIDPSMCEQGQLKRIDNTDIWYLTIEKPISSDARITYQYFKNGVPTTDPRNTFKIDGLYGPDGDQYIAELPHAKPQPYVHRESLTHTMDHLWADHRLIEETINFNQSTILCDITPYMDGARIKGLSKEQREFRKATNQGETRKYWVHLPSDYDPNHQPPYKVLVHLDGDETIKCMKLPAIMEMTPLEPTISIYIDVGNRNIEYGCGRDAELFADFLATEFMPDRRKDFPSMSSKAEDTTIAGFSMGGHAATQIGTRHPEMFGNVIGQSSSFWMGAQNPVSGEFKSTNEGLLGKLQHQNFPDEGWCSAYPSEAAKNMCFYLTVGSLETAGFHLTPSGDGRSGGVSHDQANEHFAAFLNDKKVSCEFDRYSGDHCFAEWQGGLINGLMEINKLRMMTTAQELCRKNTEPGTLGKGSAASQMRHYKSNVSEIRGTSQPGYMAPTESSEAKKREIFNPTPLQTTPKPPWRP